LSKALFVNDLFCQKIFKNFDQYIFSCLEDLSKAHTQNKNNKPCSGSGWLAKKYGTHVHKPLKKYYVSYTLLQASLFFKKNKLATYPCASIPSCKPSQKPTNKQRNKQEKNKQLLFNTPETNTNKKNSCSQNQPHPTQAFLFGWLGMCLLPGSVPKLPITF